MPVTKTTLYAVRGQAFEAGFVIKSLATGNPLSNGATGLTALASKLSKDGGNYVATTTAPTEILEADATTKSGTGYFALSANEMDAALIILVISASNTNAVYHIIEIRTAVLTESAGHWMDAPIKRLEQGTVDISAFIFNYHTITASLESVKDRTGAITMFSATVSGLASPGGVNRQKMS